MLNIQLWAFTPGSSDHTVLPTPLSWRASFIPSDVGALTLTYPVNGVGASVLTGYRDVEVRYRDGDDWKCPPQGRFSLMDSEIDTVGERKHPTRTYTLASYGWLLRHVLQQETTGLDESGDRIFPSQHIAHVVATLVSEAKAGGAIPDLTVDNNAGPGNKNHHVPVGKSAADLLATAHDYGTCEWLMQPDGSGQGRRLTLYSSLGTNRSTGNNPVTVRYASNGDVTAAPSKVSNRDIAGKAIVAGDLGRYLSKTNAGADTPYGILPVYVPAGGVSDVGSMTVVGQVALDKGATHRAQHTRAIRFEGAEFLPFVDYGLGDTILAPDESGESAPMVVRQVTLEFDRSAGLSGSLVLGDRFSTRIAKLQQQVQRLTGGLGATGGSGSTPTTPADDTRKPKAPTNLTIGSAPYTADDGTYLAIGSFGWVNPTEATDGSDMQPGSVELHYRRGTSGRFSRLTAVDYPADDLTWSPFDAGQVYQFKVRALSENNRPGPFSAVKQHTMARDTTAPPKPSTPQQHSELGTVTVSWNGHAAGGGDGMPPDYARTAVYLGTNSGFDPAPSNRVGVLHGVDFIVLTDLPYGQTRYVKLVSIDMAGNESAPSNARAVQAVRVTTADLDQNVKDALGDTKIRYQAGRPAAKSSEKMVWFDTNDGYKAHYWDGNSWTPYEYGSAALGEGAAVSRVIATGAVVTDKIATNAVKAGKIDVGHLSAISSDMGTLTAGKIVVPQPGHPDYLNINATAGTFSIRSHNYDTGGAGMVIESGTAGGNGIFMHGPGGGTVVSMNAETGNVYFSGSTTVGGTITGAHIRTNATGARVEMTSYQFQMLDSSGDWLFKVTSDGYLGLRSSAGSPNLLIDANGLTLQNSSGQNTVRLSGQDGSAYFSGPIVSGGTITGATVQTSNSNPRVVMSGDRFELINGSGNDLVLFDASDRSLMIRSNDSPSTRGGFFISDSSGILAWDSGGTQRLSIPPNGDITITGATVRSGTSGDRVEITPSVMQMLKNGNWIFKVDTSGYLGIRTKAGAPNLLIDPNGLTLKNSGGTRTVVLDGSTGNADFSGTVRASRFVGTQNNTGTFANGTYSGPYIAGGAGYVNGNMYATGSGRFRSSNSASHVEMRGAGLYFYDQGLAGSITANATYLLVDTHFVVSGYLTLPGVYDHTTSVSVSNLWMDANGSVYRTSSSLRQKAGVRPLRNPRRILSIDAEQWYDPKHPEHGTGVGFIAERVARQQLQELVDRDKDGSVASVRYQSVIGFHHAVIKENDARIAALEARLEAAGI